MADHSAMLHPRGSEVMALLSGYFDESETQNSVSGMAGLVGTLEQWAVFEGAWAKALAADGREYLHMKEHREYVTDPTLLVPYVQAIEAAGLFGVGHFVVLPHLEAFNAERKCRVQAYSLALYGCLLEMADRFPDGVDILSDRGDQVGKRIALALDYARTDRFYRHDRWPVIDRKMSIKPIRKDRDIRDFPALQGADLLAWELRRRGHEKIDFLLDHKNGDDPDQWHQQEIDWFLDAKGSWPAQRSSLSLLLRSDVETMVWDRRAIEIAHGVRHSWQSKDTRGL
jgi:hypothetical protein